MKSPTAYPVFYRTYSRFIDGKREDWAQVTDRVVGGLIETGDLTPEEAALLTEQQLLMRALPSGRLLWVGGTEWSKRPENFPGSYNCSSTNIDSFDAMASLMNLAMMGCGCGANLEHKHVDKLPPITTTINLSIADSDVDVDNSKGFVHPEIAKWEKEYTSIDIFNDGRSKSILIKVGDSRKGWVDAYRELLLIASSGYGEVDVVVDLSYVRPTGQKLKGFGGVANPIRLPDLFINVAKITNSAIGRQLTPTDCAKIIGSAAMAVVAGNIRRSAGINQFDSNDIEAIASKDNLWVEIDGVWAIDPERDMLRLANHTIVYHKKPTLEQCIESVTKQYYSGEGAIMWAGEAVARANADILNTRKLKKEFLANYPESADSLTVEQAGRYGLNPCLSAGTMVLTRAGHFPIEELVDKTVEVWDGDQWVTVDNFRVTGLDQPVFSVTLQNGQDIVATGYHSFVLEDGSRKMTSELLPGDRLLTHDITIDSGVDTEAAYLKGFLMGDGTNSQGSAVLALYSPKYCCEERLIESAEQAKTKELSYHGGSSIPYQRTDFSFSCERYGRKMMSGLASVDLINWTTTYRDSLPPEIFNWSLKSKCEFIAGVMDSDGTCLDGVNGYGYQLTSVNQKWLLSVQLLLKSIGIDSKQNPARKGGLKDFGSSRGGIYHTKDTFRISIAQVAAARLANLCTFTRLKSLADREPTYRLRPKWNKVESITFSHIADKVYCCTVPTNHQFSLTNGITLGQCAEIVLQNNFCNLSEVHLNNLDPDDFDAQQKAFTAAGLSVAVLLNHKFTDPRYQTSREADPIVGVSFTGLFDFFVAAFGIEWLEWWRVGRPKKWGVEMMPGRWQSDYFTDREQDYLRLWHGWVTNSVQDYCYKHGLKIPNRCTAVQPAGSKSLLTGASCGFHAPKAAQYIRRITFAKNDPVALACIDYGYTVVPSQSDKDLDGNLLDDPYSDRCTEWLVEIPVSVPWADLPGVDNIDISKFSALAQFDFAMQVQKHYVTHNLSATIELRESEITDLATAIYGNIQSDEGYISAALLARFDSLQTFPRLPFEPIDRAKYLRLSEQVLERRTRDFKEALDYYDSLDSSSAEALSGAAGCDGDKCLMPEKH